MRGRRRSVPVRCRRRPAAGRRPSGRPPAPPPAIASWACSEPRSAPRPRRRSCLRVDAPRMMSCTPPSATPAVPTSVRTASTTRRIRSVARAVSNARSLTSPATTAKPLPASPARADSIVALSARRLVWSAMPEMPPAIWSISVIVPANRRRSRLPPATASWPPARCWSPGSPPPRSRRWPSAAPSITPVAVSTLGSAGTGVDQLAQAVLAPHGPLRALLRLPGRLVGRPARSVASSSRPAPGRPAARRRAGAAPAARGRPAR